MKVRLRKDEVALITMKWDYFAAVTDEIMD
jgi:hypothetical protein